MNLQQLRRQSSIKKTVIGQQSNHFFGIKVVYQKGPLKMPLTVKELLTSALDNISDRNRWCQGALGRTATGSPVGDIFHASKFCAWGSVNYIAATQNPPIDLFGPELLQARTLLNGAAIEILREQKLEKVYSIISLNDKPPADEAYKLVIQCYKLAIERAS